MFRFSSNVRVNRSTVTCLSEGGGGAWHFFRAAFITRARRRDRVAAAASCGSRDARREHVVYSLIKLGRNAYARTDILPASSSDCLENLLPRCLVLLIEFACRAASEAGDARWPRGAGAALCCECLLLPVPCAQCPVPGALPRAQCPVRSARPSISRYLLDLYRPFNVYYTALYTASVNLLLAICFKLHYLLLILLILRL